MKSTKKITAMILCAALLFSFCIASADVPEITADVSDYSVTVSGSLETSRAKTDLILRMKDGSGNDILAEATTSFFKGGDVVYEFDRIFLPESLISGSYTFEITGEELTAPITAPYEYIGPDRILAILRTIRDASDIGSTVCANAAELSLDVSDYSLLSADGAAMFETIMSRVSYNLPDTHEGSANREQIKNETKKLFDAYADAICVSLFESIEDAADVSAWLSEYYNALGFNTDADETEYSEEAITAYLETVKTGETFKNKLVAANDLDTADKIQDYVYESALLSVIAEKRSSVVKEMMLAFPQLFDIEKDALGELTVSQQSQCFTNITGTVYDTYASAASALNAEILKLNPPEDDPPSGGGNGGGNNGAGKGNNGGRDSVVIGATSSTGGAGTTANIQSGKKEFTDMNSSHWAYDAVQLLCERGIISGHGDNTFAPDDNVTRAEFIKMITVAMALKSSGTETPFADVNADDWYAPYAAMAYREGIVLGDSEGKFNPDANITREDMVTILYRAMKITATNVTPNFSDADKISSYAKTAVAYFGSKGIVNGMGDGSFAPKAGATRAQAAKILYNIITS